MTVSQSQHEILWEPLSPREAVESAIASLRVDGLELDEFGAALMQRVADEEIDDDEAIALALQHYRR
jgi:Antitoxin VbhA